MNKIHSGAIGDMRALYTTYNTGYVWSPFERKEGWTDLQYQVKNWYYHTWLSGDHLVEQAIHSLDKMCWAMKDVPPIKCVATGGRQVRTGPEFGNIFDHFAIVYDYPNNVKGFHFSRQQLGCAADNSDLFMGANGVAQIVRAFSGPFVVKGKENWRFREEKPTDMYQEEHNELFAAIRKGEPINDGVWMAHSTLVGIMGRMAAYTGQEITWEQALNSQESLVPATPDWNAPAPVHPVAMPGQTKIA
jgi:predicted dehydrogenase